jgi:hypothetical protein
MNFNFFDWIREGVKQSVLLGISDATETIGSPNEVDHVNQQLFVALRKGTGQTAALAGHSPGGPPRKHLGRSLQQIMEQDDAGARKEPAKIEKK